MIRIQPYPTFLKIADALLIPGMRLISGAPREAPQETHLWNLQPLSDSLRSEINPAFGVAVSGSYHGVMGKEHAGVLFHFPIFGGWKEYLVLEADTHEPWHMGWLLTGMKRDYFEFSRLSLTDSRVRVLKTPLGTNALFFALGVDGNQIPLRTVAEGTIGDSGPFKNLRLL